MRVTNKMISSQILYNLSKASARYLDLQQQSSTGKRINKPSDDPVGITKDLTYRSQLSDISQFSTNVTYATSWLTYSDDTLSNIDDLIIEAKELAVQLANDTYDESARAAAVSEIQEIYNQIMDAVNTQYQGKYIFGGSATDTAPLTSNGTGVEYNGDLQDLLLEIESDSFLRINSFATEFATTQVNTLGEDSDINPGLQPSLWLSYLNSGEGIEMGAGEIVVNTLNGSYTVDIGSADPTNVEELLDAINSAGIPNFTASISESGSGITFEDTTKHEITLDTPLSMLNKGEGVSQEPGTFRIRTSDSSLVADIDISGATNLDDVINEINTQLAAAGINNVTASLQADENKIVITDMNAASYDLVIEEVGDGSTASDLGILGEMHGQLLGEDLDPMHIQVEESAEGETLAASLGIDQQTQSETLLGDDLDPELTYNTLISSLNSNSGIELGSIRIDNGLESVVLDLSVLNDDPDATILDLVDMINTAGIGAKAYVNSDGTGIMVLSEDDDKSFTITEADSGSTATSLGIFGAGDLMGNMLVLESALEDNNIEQIEATLDVFDEALDQLLIVRASVGTREIRADTAETRLLSLELLVTEQLSDVEDADILKVVTELATAETLYESALAAAASVIQPTLMDFLS